MRPLLLDLFCGAGGAAMGYHRAGFSIVGVDIVAQPRYPFEFVQADAMQVLDDLLAGRSIAGGYVPSDVDAIHASPPCQDHTTLSKVAGSRGTGWMLAATIALARRIGVPWVIENVPGAHRLMPGAYRICGKSMGLYPLRRHRLFLTEVAMLVPSCSCSRRDRVVGVYGDLRVSTRSQGRPGHHSVRAGITVARDLMGCPWMTGQELAQAIPPAYTQLVGEQLMAALVGAS